MIRTYITCGSRTSKLCTASTARLGVQTTNPSATLLPYHHKRRSMDGTMASSCRPILVITAAAASTSYCSAATPTQRCHHSRMSCRPFAAFRHISQHLQRQKQGVHARKRLVAYAATEAAECIAKGQEKYNAGDRMGALKFFEQSLQKSPTQQERQAALFNSTAVHASFGDVELAQITLREGISYGLDFKKALKDSEDSQLVKFQGSPQIVIQLQKFAEAVKRIKGAVGSVNDKKAAPAAAPSGKSAYSSDTVFGRDISSILGTDLTDIDPSVGGIIKRVAGLLLVGLVLAVVLFYVGLRFTFPEQYGQQ